MEIDKALNPFGSIAYGRNLAGSLDATTIQFAEREPLKRFRFRHPREIGMSVGRHNRFSIDHGGVAHFAHHQGFGFRPFAMQQGYKSSIQAQEQFVWPMFDRWPV